MRGKCAAGLSLEHWERTRTAKFGTKKPKQWAEGGYKAPYCAAHHNRRLLSPSCRLCWYKNNDYSSFDFNYGYLFILSISVLIICNICNRHNGESFWTVYFFASLLYIFSVYILLFLFFVFLRMYIYTVHYVYFYLVYWIRLQLPITFTIDNWQSADYVLIEDIHRLAFQTFNNAHHNF